MVCMVMVYIVMVCMVNGIYSYGLLLALIRKHMAGRQATATCLCTCLFERRCTCPNISMYMYIRMAKDEGVVGTYERTTNVDAAAITAFFLWHW